MPAASPLPVLDPTRPVTLKDVAAQADVSPMSVSAVLNGGGRGTRYVSQEARERILRAAAELGYRRNGSAAATATGRFGSVALLTSSRPMHSYTPQNLLNGINAELALYDMHLMVANLPDEKLTDEQFVPKILREWMADGLIIDYIQDIPRRLIEIIERHQIPAVWLNSNQEFNCVHPDDFEAGGRATRYLVEMGHRGILFADFSHSSRLHQEHYSAGDRCNGYLAVMAASGLEPRISRGETASTPHTEWIAVATEILTRPERPTAVITYGGEVSAFIVAALQLGLRVPQDLSVINFGAAGAEFAGIPMTAMLNPNFEMGQGAVRMLREKIASPAERIPVQKVTFGFCSGATCAPPI